MTDIESKTAKAKPPKGGRKGGALFPKINLEQALEHAKKLVGKTYTGPLPATTILPGVFGSAGPTGQVRAAALKQFGLLEGKTDAYRATQLARDIDAALYDERPTLLRRSLLTSKVFRQIFETYQGDTVSKAKIEQRAKGLKVHTESASDCAQIFIESAITAGLGTPNGDGITLVRAGETAPADETAPEEVREETAIEESEKEPAAVAATTATPDPPKTSPNGRPAEPEKPRAEKPAVTLSLTVDPTSDPEKLEKQLKLLRQYGVI